MAKKNSIKLREIGLLVMRMGLGTIFVILTWSRLFASSEGWRQAG